MDTTLKEILTGSHKIAMVHFVAQHPEHFKELVQLAIADKQPYSWRAAWLLWSCMRKDDGRVKAYVPDFIRVLPNRPYNQQRELLKILYLMEIGSEQQGALFNHCIVLWEELNKQVSVRFNAFKMMIKIAEQHPELFHEIKIFTQQQYLKSLSPGVMRSVSKMINGISP